MRKLVYLSLFIVWSCALGMAAEPSLLPDGFGVWRSEGPPASKSGNAALPDGSEIKPGTAKEAGLTTVEARNYTNGTTKLALRLYKFKDTSGAYEFYTHVITTEMQQGGLGDESAIAAKHEAVLIGNFVLIADSENGEIDQGALNTVVTMVKSKADATPYPPLRSYLPAHWRVFGTEKYSQGAAGFENAMELLDLGAYKNLAKDVGFEDGAEAIFAKFRGEHGSGTLLIVQYPTPQLAEQHLRHLRESLPAGSAQNGVAVERKTSLLTIVFAPSSAMHAQAIRDEVDYETQVTWNEPSSTATDPPIVLIMFKIFLFTSLFLVVATVAGLFFGGVRVLVKHWLPGKVFDRPEDIEVLQLGLSGKKIDPTDMY